MLFYPFFILTLFFVYSKGESCDSEPCKDLRTAKSCDKVNYCITNDWSSRTPTKGEGDNVCQICLKMVKEARDQLESNETRVNVIHQEQLKEVFEGSCKLLVLHPIVKECDKLVDEFAEELVAILASQMDPEVVCSVAKLCGSTEMLESLPACTRCQNFMVNVRYILDVVPEERVKSRALAVCRHLGSYSDACYFYVQKNFETLYKEAKIGLEERPCEVLNVCPKNSPVLALEKGFTEKSFCEYCTPVTEILQKEYSSLNLDSESICKLIPQREELCKAFLGARDPTLSEKFFGDVCSSEVCSPLSEGVPIWPLLPGPVSVPEDDPSVVREWIGVLKEPEKVRKPISSGDPVEASFFWKTTGDTRNDCKACNDMFVILSGRVNSDDEYLKRVFCRDLSAYEECKKFVDDHREYLKNALVNSTDPKEVCPELAFPCSSSDDFSTKDVSLENSCNFCLKTFQSLIPAFKESDAAEHLKERFLASCDSMPVDSRQKCKRFVNDFVEATVRSLATKYDEKDACGFLQLCGGQTPSERKVETTAKGETETPKNPTCQICMMVVETLYEKLGNKRSVEEIREALDKLCHKLPHSVRSDCQKVVDNFTDEVVDLIIHSASPAMVCRSLSFCPVQISTRTETTPHPPKLLGHPGEADRWTKKVPCNLCLTVMKMAIEELEDSQNEEEIRKALDKLCNYFPEETKDTCRNLIDQYAEDIVDMIIADFNATEVCVFLKLCSPHRAAGEVGERGVFDVATNEIRDGENPSGGSCSFCRFLERSMSVEGNQNKAAEGLLALLAETCLMYPSKAHSGCAEKMADKVLPHGANALLNMTDVCEEFSLCPREESDDRRNVLDRIHSAVQECAMCEALVEIVTTHEKMTTKSYDFPANAHWICSSVPKNKNHQCMTMLVSYGPSIVNLYVTQKIDPDHICFHLRLCDESLQTKVRMPVTDIEQSGVRKPTDQRNCLRGPTFWCANLENAKRCGTYLHCREAVWKNGVPPQ